MDEADIANEYCEKMLNLAIKRGKGKELYIVALENVRAVVRL